MLPPESYKKARIEARIHVQVELDPIYESVEALCLNFAITGKIIRIFRGYQVCKIGQINKNIWNDIRSLKATVISVY